MNKPLQTTRMLVEIVAIVGIAETAVMFMLPCIAVGCSASVEAVLDATFLSIIAAPLILWRVRSAVRRMGTKGLTGGGGGFFAAAACAVALLGLLLTAGIVVQIRSDIQTRAHMVFERLTERLVGEIQRRANMCVYGLKGARGAYAASDVLTRADFQAYVESRDLPNEFPGVMGLGFIERVQRDKLDDFLARERADGAPGFAIRTTGSHPVMYIVKHCFPIDQNAIAWGYDLSSDPRRREAAEQAIDTGQPTVTCKLLLNTAEGASTGFLYLLPVYAKGSHPTTPQQRREALVGLVYARIGITETVASVATVVKDQLDFEIYDGQEPTAENSLFDLDGHPYHIAGKIEDEQHEETRAFHRFTKIDVGGRTWTVATSTTPEFDAQLRSDMPAAASCVGIVISVLSAFALWSLGTARQRADAMARSMTSDLQRLAMVAQRTTNAVVVTDAQGLVVWANEGFTRITGYTLEESLGRKPGEMLQCEHTDPDTVAMLREAIRTGSSCRVEILNRGKSGREYTIDLELQPIHDEVGKLTGYMAIETDISERLAQQASLQASQSLLAATGQVAGIGGWEFDPINETLTWTEQTRRIYEVSPEYQPTIDGLLSFYHPDAREPIQAAMERCLLERDSWDLELPFVTGAGRHVWVRSVGRAEVRDGRTVRIYGALQDITEQKQANNALRDREEAYRALFDCVPAAVFVCDKDAVIQRYNRRAAELWGREPVLGVEKYCGSLRLFMPDGTPLPHEMSPVSSVLGGGPPVRGVEVIIERPDQSRLPVVVNFAPLLDGHGEVMGSIVCFDDISARKDAEHKLSEAYAALEEAQTIGRVGNWTYDARTGQATWSTQVFLFFGLDPTKSPPTLEEVYHLYSDEDQATLRRANELTLREGKPHTLVLRTRNPVAGVRYLKREGRARRDAQGNIVSVYGTVTDITVETEREAELHTARLEAEAATKAKSAFLANMSHEIRTPMTAILGYADLLADTGEHARTPQERAEFVNTIRRNGEHLLSLINDILDVSKIEAGRMTVECIAVRPEQILGDVCSLMQVKAHDKRIALSLTQGTPLPGVVRGDPVRLKQILVNLVGNAIKFTETGSVSVRTSFDPGSAFGPALRFEVSDTGIGMNEEQVEGLFCAFSQADTTTTRRFGGTGLGLIISKSLAQLLGGDITVSSELGKGSTFTLTIPTRVSTNAPADFLKPRASQHAAETARPAHGESPLKGVRIFLAEDGADNQRLISFHLKKAGADVHIFDNGDLAMRAMTADGSADGALLAEPACDIVITDMQMPVLDGYSFARRLRARGWTRSIIALTAHAMSGDAEKCMDAGCDLYATKPVDRAHLIDLCIRAMANVRREMAA